MARDTSEVDLIARRAISLLRERMPVAQAYLFGSHVEGTANEDSDIDIAAFSPSVDAMSLQARIELIVNLEKHINAPIELHLFGSKDFSEARPTNFFGYLRAHGKSIA